MVMLSDSLIKNMHLTELDIGCNMIRDDKTVLKDGTTIDAFQAIKDLVTINQTLKSLNLEDNSLGDEMGKSILHHLDMNTGLQLTSLDVSGNHLEEDTVEKINLFVRTHKAELARERQASK